MKDLLLQEVDDLLANVPLLLCGLEARLVGTAVTLECALERLNQRLESFEQIDSLPFAQEQEFSFLRVWVVWLVEVVDLE